MSSNRKLVSQLSEARIDQLSNDLSEGIASGTVRDWRAVALHFRDQLDANKRVTQSMRSDILRALMEPF